MTRHYLIIGLGLVSVKEANEQAIEATRIHTLGLSITDRPGLKFGLGYSSSETVMVMDGAENVVVEVSSLPGGPMVVDTKNATLRSHHPVGKGE